MPAQSRKTKPPVDNLTMAEAVTILTMLALLGALGFGVVAV